MAIAKIEDTRVRTLDDLPPRANGDDVLCWMQQSQRTEHNPVLEHAARRANQQREPLLVGFRLMDDYSVIGIFCYNQVTLPPRRMELNSLKPYGFPPARK